MMNRWEKRLVAFFAAITFVFVIAGNVEAVDYPDTGTISSVTDLTIWAGMDDDGAAGDLIMRRNDGAAGVYDSYIELTGSSINMGGEIVTISDGLSVTGGLDNNAGGITNAGAISEVTTLGTSGLATLNSASVTTTLGVTGATTLGSTLGVTGNTTLSTVSTSGLATLDSASITNNATVGGTFGVTGATTLSDTLDVTGATTLSDTLDVTGATTLSDTLDVTGATTLNSTLDVSGNLTATGTTNTIGTAGTSANTLTGATNTITGATTITSTTTANQMIVDATSSRFVSADGFSSADVRNEAVTLVADNDTSLSRLSMTPTTANLLVNTDAGESHGIYVGQSSTVITGGTDSTQLTLDDDGATFADEDTGAPVKVTGVADGVGDYDAVNMRQYRKLEDRVDKAYSGIASVAALTAIPSPVAGKNYSVGVGYGNFEGTNAVAIGGKALVGESRNITLSAGVGLGEDATAVSAGVGWSF